MHLAEGRPELGRGDAEVPRHEGDGAPVVFVLRPSLLRRRGRAEAAGATRTVRAAGASKWRARVGGLVAADDAPLGRRQQGGGPGSQSPALRLHGRADGAKVTGTTGGIQRLARGLLRGAGEVREACGLGLGEFQYAVGGGRDTLHPQVVEGPEQGGQGGLLRAGKDGRNAGIGGLAQGAHLVPRATHRAGVGRRAAAGWRRHQFPALPVELLLNLGDLRLLRRRELQPRLQGGKRGIGGGGRARPAPWPARVRASRWPTEWRGWARRVRRAELRECGGAESDAEDCGECCGADGVRPD